jgi:hypothetical protein
MKLQQLMVFLGSVSICCSAAGGELTARSQLLLILDDQDLLEDFEGFSLHAGTSIPAPNPLNSDTASATWGLEPGVTYSSTNSLQIYAGFFQGDDSNILQGVDNVTLQFDEPQVAVGFDLDGAGNVTYHEVINVWRDQEMLGTLEFDILPGSYAFAGWHDNLGVTSVEIATTAVGGFTIYSEVDNVGWGRVAVPLHPGDANGDGQIDGHDYLVWAENFGDNPADDPPGSPFNGDFNDDGVVGGLDYLTWAANFGMGPNDVVAVPEPSSLGLLLAAAAAVAASCTRSSRPNARRVRC